MDLNMENLLTKIKVHIEQFKNKVFEKVTFQSINELRRSSFKSTILTASTVLRSKIH